MRKVYACVKVIALLLLPGFSFSQQVEDYLFEAFQGTYTPIAGTAPSLQPDNFNPQPVNDNGRTNAISIGFTFQYLGVNYTSLYASTNGFIGFASLPDSYSDNNLGGGFTGKPVLAPFWDNHKLQSSSDLTYLVSGSAPNRVFTMQWANAAWFFGPTVNFQLKLFETSNKIQFVYGSISGGISVNAGASIGITESGFGVGSAQSLGDTGPSPIPSKTSVSNGINTFPADGQVYQFSPFECRPPANLTVSNLTTTSAAFDWDAMPASVGYEWSVTNSSTPPVSGTSTTQTSEATSGLTNITNYYIHVRNNCTSTQGASNSAWSTVPFTTPLDCAAAEVLTNCGPVTSLALTGSNPLSPGTCSGTGYSGREKLYTFTAPATGTFSINVLSTNGKEAAFFYKPVAAGCDIANFVCAGSSTTTANHQLSLTSGVSYYILAKAKDATGQTDLTFQVCEVVPGGPSCTFNISPANQALFVGSTPSTTLTWNAVAGASFYDVYFGTGPNPSTIIAANVTGNTTTVSGLALSTTYYWYVVPKAFNGTPANCNFGNTSFTTAPAANCAAVYTIACNNGDYIERFTIKGENSTAIDCFSSSFCPPLPLGNSNYEPIFSPATLSRNETYSGFIRTGNDNDYVTMWIDFNDNGYFEDTERLLNNLQIGTAGKYYAIHIPFDANTGTHVLRIRAINSPVQPATITDACASYEYGETETYRVTITATTYPRNISAGTPGSCRQIASMTIEEASNNNTTGKVMLVDSDNNYVAAIFPSGNNLGVVSGELYVQNGPLRRDANGVYYLNRNVSLQSSLPVTQPYYINIYYLNSELNDLINQPGAGVNFQGDLNLSKFNSGTCTTALSIAAGTGQFYPVLGFGAEGTGLFNDYGPLNSFSSFFLHSGGAALVPSGSILPVTLLRFTGNRQGTANVLRWATATEQNAKGAYVLHSGDGQTWTRIGFVPTKAPNGNSSSELSYSFTDNAPDGNDHYYKLELIDLDESITYSNVVHIADNPVTSLRIAGLYPNPAHDKVKMVVDAPARDQITISITDLTGRMIRQQTAALEAGTNTIDLNTTRLENGTYLIKVVNRGGTKLAVKRLVKL